MGERYSQRPKRRERTYKLDTTTISDVDALANELCVFQSSLVDLLLKRALLEVRAGNWQLEAKSVAYVPTWRE